MARALRLRDVDLSVRLAGEDEYKERKAALQIRLLQIQQAYLLQGRRGVVVFEGFDAAGKGGAIRRIVQGLDPRNVKVWPIAAPNEAERGQHYLQRFWARLPQAGEIAIFDRSWYGRVLVERVDRLASPADWKRAYREINEFERALADDGIALAKLFLHVSPEEQLRRFRERLETPYKRWKIGEEDFHNRARRKDYERAVDAMLAKTSTTRAPWRAIASDHKWHGRIASMQLVVERLARGLDLSSPPPSKRLLRLLKRAGG
jgi:polyphosphate kinase 2 (PPK2 family)